jgi:Kdo2-lipid IVA lauroyltransferase/acyltransferase
LKIKSLASDCRLNYNIAQECDKLESSLYYIAARTVLSLLRFIPRTAALGIIRQCAGLYYWLDSKHRRIARVNLRIAMPHLSERKRGQIARRSFQMTAENLLALSRMPGLTPANISAWVHYDSALGLNNYRKAVDRGKPILYLTGHFSAWELLPAAHALYGYPLSFVTRPLDDPALEKYLTRARESSGNKVISKKNAGKEILRTLRKSGSVGILVDQNTDPREAIFCEFFGLPASTSTSLALLGLRTEATVLPGYLTVMKKGRYMIKFLPPVDLIRTGDRDQDIRQNTCLFNRVLESIIREQPESWLWGHKRWHYQDQEEPGLIYRLNQDALDKYLQKHQKTSPGTD